MDYTFPPKARFVQLHHSYDFAALGVNFPSHCRERHVYRKQISVGVL